MLSLAVLLSFSALIHPCKSANILLLPFHDSGSHLASLTPYFTRLASLGHNVTILYTLNKEPASYPPNIHLVPAKLLSLGLGDDREQMSRIFWGHTVHTSAVSGVFSSGDRMLGTLMSEYPEKVRLDKLDKLSVADELIRVGKGSVRSAERHVISFR